MSGLKQYVSALAKTYGDKVECTPSGHDEQALAVLPEALRELYREYDRIDLPFGYTYSLKTALEQSTAEPFQSEGWFCFGFDRYFSFWLCKLAPDAKNLSFTTWDHDVEEIGGAIYQTVVELLENEQEEYEENRNLGSVELDELPEDKLKFLAALRKAFSLPITTQQLLEAAEDLPYTVAENIPYADAEEMMDETAHPECFSFYSNDFV